MSYTYMEFYNVILAITHYTLENSNGTQWHEALVQMIFLSKRGRPPAPEVAKAGKILGVFQTNDA